MHWALFNYTIYVFIKLNHKHFIALSSLFVFHLRDGPLRFVHMRTHLLRACSPFSTLSFPTTKSTKISLSHALSLSLAFRAGVMNGPYRVVVNKFLLTINESSHWIRILHVAWQMHFFLFRIRMYININNAFNLNLWSLPFLYTYM